MVGKRVSHVGVVLVILPNCDGLRKIYKTPTGVRAAFWRFADVTSG